MTVHACGMERLAEVVDGHGPPSPGARGSPYERCELRTDRHRPVDVHNLRCSSC